MFDQVVRKWLVVVKPMSTQIFFNSKLVGGLETKEGVYGLQEESLFANFDFYFLLVTRNWKYISNRMHNHCFSYVLTR